MKINHLPRDIQDMFLGYLLLRTDPESIFQLMASKRVADIVMQLFKCSPIQNELMLKCMAKGHTQLLEYILAKPIPFNYAEITDSLLENRKLYSNTNSISVYVSHFIQTNFTKMNELSTPIKFCLDFSITNNRDLKVFFSNDNFIQLMEDQWLDWLAHTRNTKFIEQVIEHTLDKDIISDDIFCKYIYEFLDSGNLKALENMVTVDQLLFKITDDNIGPIFFVSVKSNYTELLAAIINDPVKWIFLCTDDRGYVTESILHCIHFGNKNLDLILNNFELKKSEILEYFDCFVNKEHFGDSDTFHDMLVLFSEHEQIKGYLEKKYKNYSQVLSSLSFE
ncbi:hypothetical protein HDV01_002311 [Terramyces sp. JEL0728]|nr:hypothetical protein HDV01_002311 [Terramyces sp. JEL0728]